MDTITLLLHHSYYYYYTLLLQHYYSVTLQGSQAQDQTYLGKATSLQLDANKYKLAQLQTKIDSLNWPLVSGQAFVE